MLEFNDNDGLHVYALAPETVSVAEFPWQTLVLDDAFTLGNGFTVTDLVAVPLHPFVVPVTVYVTLEYGDAVTVEAVVELSPVDGDHV